VAERENLTTEGKRIAYDPDSHPGATSNQNADHAQWGEEAIQIIRISSKSEKMEYRYA
jgi:hypothetical protein